MRYVVIALSICVLFSSRASANCGPIPQALVLLDRSGSMTELVAGQSKWNIASGAVNSVVGTFVGQIDFGLMLFPRWPHVADCSSGEVNVPVAPSTSGAIAAALSGTYPDGNTPLALSLDEARLHLQQIKIAGPAQYVILITDGMETCQPTYVNTPQLAASKLMADGVKTYVVGFGGGVDPASLIATAQAGGTGSYFQADNLTQLNAALTQIAALLSCCGDAKLDPGELCDTGIPAGSPGACPTSCDDGNPCTQDVKVGSACQTACAFTAVTAPVNGDGCCPPGANSQTDSDCPPSCGNGVLEPGEQCDTGIPAGQWGGCPTSCDDGNPCTTDTLAGSGCAATCAHVNTCSTKDCGNGKLDPGEWCDVAIGAGQPGSCPKSCDDGDPCTKDNLGGADCLAKCTNVPISVPVGGDGCCPPGANSQTDSDCPATCGNGVLDKGESCDPGIQSGPGSCATDCDDNNVCTKDLFGGSGCDVKCSHSPIAADPTNKDGCCPAGLTDAQDADCPPACDPDKQQGCVDPCQGVQCPDGQYCKAGTCVPWPKTPTSGETEAGEPGAAPSTGPAGNDWGDGCACRTADGPPGAWLTAILLLLLFGIRRRSR